MGRRIISSKRKAAGRRAGKSRDRSFEDISHEFMDLALEAAQCRELPSFLTGLAARASEMLRAEWGAVGEIHGNGVELHHRNPVIPANESDHTWLAARANKERSGLEVVRWEDKASFCIFHPIHASDHELMGTLCLVRADGELCNEEERLLAALSGYAALVMEKVRRFSQLERSKKQWVEDIDAISDYIVVHDQAWKIVRTNRSLASYLGIPPAALVGEAMHSLRHIAETGSALPCPFCQNTSAPREEYIATGEGRTFIVSTSRKRGATEEEGRTIHVLKDISDRREAERRYRELFDNIQEGLFFATPDGQFLDVNDAMVRMLGYDSREELLRADVSAHLYPTLAAKERLVQTIAQRGALRNYEETLRRKDGGLLHTLQNISAVRDAQGRIIQIRGLMLDVTEQKMFQSQLQRERDFNQRILNTTQSMILVLDTAGLISYANRRCFEAGYRERELIGQRLVQLVESTDRRDFEAALQTTANGQQVENLELRVRRSDGSVGHFSVSLSPSRDELNQVNSVVVVMTDITDAVLLQAKLAHAEKMATIGRLVSGVAHEVNNPLAAILGFTDLLLEDSQIPESAREELQIILRETQRTKEIVQGLLSFARQRPTQREAMQVNAILRQTIRLRSYDFSSHGVQVTEEFNENLQMAMGDAQQLQQVFLNILNNAYDAIQESGNRGKIRIRTRQTTDFIEVAFIDNGTGVSEPERIFDPFFTTKPAGKGTGLGLSICYGIVRAHGGEISCWNNEGESGSTFVVRLPIATESALAAAATEAGQ
ncbi:MAG TPA: PAS domain S-box protein [Candidatus Eremiobacteraceae bacterium]|nr:PAS domain S-box protein [Candidatus Eremiobacteraceae bacterium]